VSLRCRSPPPHPTACFACGCASRDHQEELIARYLGEEFTSLKLGRRVGYVHGPGTYTVLHRGTCVGGFSEVTVNRMQYVALKAGLRAPELCTFGGLPPAPRCPLPMKMSGAVHDVARCGFVVCGGQPEVPLCPGPPPSLPASGVVTLDWLRFLLSPSNVPPRQTHWQDTQADSAREDSPPVPPNPSTPARGVSVEHCVAETALLVGGAPGPDIHLLRFRGPCDVEDSVGGGCCCAP
jgi:hypothetical protein